MPRGVIGQGSAPGSRSAPRLCTDYAAIARGFDVAQRFQRPKPRTAPEAAAASGLPAVIDCRVAFVPMSYFGAIGKGHAEPV